MHSYRLIPEGSRSNTEWTMQWDDNRLVLLGPDGVVEYECSIKAVHRCIDFESLYGDGKVQLVLSAGVPVIFRKDFRVASALRELVERGLTQDHVCRRAEKHRARHLIGFGLTAMVGGGGLFCLFVWYAMSATDPPVDHWIRGFGMLIFLLLLILLAFAIAGPVVLWRALRWHGHLQRIDRKVKASAHLSMVQHAADDSAAFSRLIDNAMRHLHELTLESDRIWDLARSDWMINPDAAQVVFTLHGDVGATARVQIVGTYNTSDHIWLWGWADEKVPTAMGEDARRMLAYGQAQSIPPLTSRQMVCTEERCWELVSVACLHCEADGALCQTRGDTQIFMIFGDRVFETGKRGDKSEPISSIPDAGTEALSADEARAEQEMRILQRSNDGSHGKSPTEVVIAFIQEHCAWEIASFERTKDIWRVTNAEDRRKIDVVRQEYRRLISRFCIASFDPDPESLSSEPVHDPKHESIVSESVEGVTAAVVTKIAGILRTKARYEYHLVRLQDEWRIKSWRCVYGKGKRESK